MDSCQTGPGSLGSSVHTELYYNSCTVTQCISPLDPMMESCQTGPRSLGSSVHTELHYNFCTVPEYISPVDP